MTPSPDAIANTWPARIGGVLIVVGTGLSMVLQNWQSEVAMGVALIGLVLVLVRRGKSPGR